jgi:hypothetical protein
VRYLENNPPLVVPANMENLELDEEAPFKTQVYNDFRKLQAELIDKYHYLSGDVNWGGILNIALDLRGQQLFIDMVEIPDKVHRFFRAIRNVISRFVSEIEQKTGTSSLSVNRNLVHLDQPVFLHSECSHTMISEEMYREFLLGYDIEWAEGKAAFGIHYCGRDPHRFGTVFSEIPNLVFLDVGWGGDLKLLREKLPRTFLNIRLSPVEIIDQSHEQLTGTIRSLVSDAADPLLTGVCCINMDEKVTDDRITAIFDTVAQLRKELH